MQSPILDRNRERYYKTGYDAINSLTGGKLGQVVESVKTKLSPMLNTIEEQLKVYKSIWQCFWKALEFNKSNRSVGKKWKWISVFNGIKTKISEKFNGIKEAVGEKLSSIGDAANGIKSKIAEKFTSVKTAITEKFAEIKTRKDSSCRLKF